MIKQILVLALACVTSSAYAEPSPCRASEQITKLKEKLSRYNWEMEASRSATPKGPTYFPPSLIGPFPVACVAIAVDEMGKAKDAVVYYPRKARLSRAERNELMRSAYAPGKANNVAIPSIFIMTIAYPNR